MKYAAVTRDEGNTALRLPVVRISLYNRPLRAVSLSNGRWAFSDSLKGTVERFIRKEKS